MDQTKVAAGNVTFSVKDIHSRFGDGVSVNISAEVAGNEVSIIRLDWFPGRPHYHYRPGQENSREVSLDPALIGDDSLGWFLERMPSRLSSMIENAGFRDVARAVDGTAVTLAMSDVMRAARVLADSVTTK